MIRSHPCPGTNRPEVVAQLRRRFRPGPRPASGRCARTATNAPGPMRPRPGGLRLGIQATGKRGWLQPAWRGAGLPAHARNWSLGDTSSGRDLASVHRANAHQPLALPPNERRQLPQEIAVVPGRCVPTRGPTRHDKDRHHDAIQLQPSRAAAWRPTDTDPATGVHQ